MAHSGCVSSRILRIPRHSAATLWLRPVAAPSSLPVAAKGAAWLRPWLFCRMPRDSKYSSKAAARVCQSLLLAVLRMCYENKFKVVI